VEEDCGAADDLLAGVFNDLDTRSDVAMAGMEAMLPDLLSGLCMPAGGAEWLQLDDQVRGQTRMRALKQHATPPSNHNRNQSHAPLIPTSPRPPKHRCSTFPLEPMAHVCSVIIQLLSPCIHLASSVSGSLFFFLSPRVLVSSEPCHVLNQPSGRW
jgi:hypothetical protein